MSFQFNHNMENGVCCVVSEITKSSLEMLLLSNEKEFTFMFGLAQCSSKDTYDRKVGRSVSVSRALDVVFSLYSVIWSDTKQYWIFKSGNNAISFSTCPESSRAYFIHYEICE